MDTTQLLLTIVLSLTTILLVIVGVQLIFVLRELKTTLHNVNKIIEGFETMGTGLHHGVSEVVGFLNGFKAIVKTVELAKLKKNEKNK
ncbi:hypothetical protein HGA88_00975 [Candidatus Roizmanbacteria bacterium]|nr:hypothetical protein [Candidatus Roizmanbacteria bacterium]